VILNAFLCCFCRDRAVLLSANLSSTKINLVDLMITSLQGCQRRHRLHRWRSSGTDFPENFVVVPNQTGGGGSFELGVRGNSSIPTYQSSLIDISDSETFSIILHFFKRAYIPLADLNNANVL
jgi:hypothetical protein